jgi:uncharacterized protein YegL
MARDVVIRKQDLFNNPSARLPVCLVLDCSPSMSGDPDLGAVVRQTHPRPIDELNAGVDQFFREVWSDEIAASSAEVCVIAFSGQVTMLQDFGSITRMVAVPKVELQGNGTSIGSAIDVALRALEARKNEFKDAGVDYFQPWLVVMTDGQPTDGTHLAVAARVQDLIRSRRLTTFCVGIGTAADLDALRIFTSPDRPPLRLRGLAFKNFFAWLSQSVSKMSDSIPCENRPLPPADDWAQPGPDKPWQ